jgi:hypothetical protein
MVKVIYFCLVVYVLCCGEIYNCSYKRLYYHYLLCIILTNKELGNEKKRTNSLGNRLICHLLATFVKKVTGVYYFVGMVHC